MRLIDADALKELIWNKVYLWDIVKAIDAAPTIDAAEVRHGKLLRTEAYPHKLYCGECYNTLIPNDEAVEHNWMLKPKYCMYCGAKLDEE